MTELLEKGEEIHGFALGEVDAATHSIDVPRLAICICHQALATSPVALPSPLVAPPIRVEEHPKPVSLIIWNNQEGSARRCVGGSTREPPRAPSKEFDGGAIRV